MGGLAHDGGISDMCSGDIHRLATPSPTITASKLSASHHSQPISWARLPQPAFRLWRKRSAAIRYSTAPMPAIFKVAGQSSAKPTPLRKMPMAISM